MKQVTAILIGAGQRGMNVYADYALRHPDELRFVAVAEPDERRRNTFCALHGIGPENTFESFEALLDRPPLSDLALVCTQDNMHVRPARLALARGYHVLCEKPISKDPAECVELGALARQCDKNLTICHVLRYSPFFREIKWLLDGGAIGTLIHTSLTEHVGYWHFAHSFARGNWRSAERSSPMILQKSCHDMDLLLWMQGEPCVRVSSFGSLSYFNEAHAPAGSQPRCKGCAAAKGCPYDAYRIYLGRTEPFTRYLRQVVSPNPDSDAAVAEALDTGDYGRCVFHCDNDVVDHQTVNLEFQSGATASFVMCAFNSPGGRTIELMGTRGQIAGDMEAGDIACTDFLTGETASMHIETPADGHGGSDDEMMKAVVESVRRGEATPSAADVSVMSHLMALAAEESRLTGRMISMEAFARHPMES